MSRSRSRWSYGFGGVFIRDNGKWYYWLNINGKRVIKSTKGAQNRKEAVAVLMKARNIEFKKKYFKGCETEEISFSDFCDEFESLNGNKNEKYMIYQLKNSSYFKDKKVHEIRPKDVEDYVNDKLKLVSRGTTNRHVGLLRRILNKAEKRGYRVPKVKPVIHGDHIKKVDSRDVTLTVEEELLLIECAGSTLRSIIVCALHTGMRKGEILSLEWKDVDFDYGQIHVRAENSKTHQDRYIPIDNKLFSVLDKLKAENGSSQYIFNYYNKSRKEYHPYTDIVKPFIKARKKAGLNYVHFHDLRHTFATRCVKAGVDLFSLMKLLGHSNVETTQRYVNLRDVDLLPAIEKLERFYEERSRKVIQKCTQTYEDAVLYPIN